MPDLMIHDPFGPNGFRSAVERIFDEPLFRGFPTIASLVPADSALAVDVSERDGKLVVSASLPGFKNDEIDVQVHGGVLTVKGERKQESEEKTEKFYRRERSWGSVSRSVTLPAKVDETAVDAELKNGVLTVSLPLLEQRAPKSIAVRNGE